MAKAKAAKKIVKNPVFIYTSECCKVPATKEACVRSDSKEWDENPLGKWRCGNCQKRCKVTHARNQSA